MIDCFKNNEICWKILGIHPNRNKNVYLFIYSNIFPIIFIIGYDIICTVNIYFIPLQLDTIIEDMILYFSMVVVASKIICFVLLMDKVERVLKILDSDLFKPEGDTERNILYTANKFISKSWKIYTILSYSSHIAHVIFPFVVHIIKSTKLDLPVCGYYFLSENTTQRFIYLIYLYQSVGIHFHMLTNVNIDSFLVGLLILLIAQLDIVAYKMKNTTIFERSHKRQLNATKQREVLEDGCVLKLNNALKHYEEVTTFCDLLEEVFTIIIFFQFSIASVIICVCLFRFTLLCPWQYYIFLSSYMSIMIVQILIPCWFGTKVMEKSCLLSKAIYECNWTPRSRRFKSSMRLFVERANRALSITGWKMFPLSLSTFTSIMNTAYSFFTLLRHIQSRED